MKNEEYEGKYRPASNAPITKYQKTISATNQLTGKRNRMRRFWTLSKSKDMGRETEKIIYPPTWSPTIVKKRKCTTRVETKDKCLMLAFKLEDH